MRSSIPVERVFGPLLLEGSVRWQSRERAPRRRQ